MVTSFFKKIIVRIVIGISGMIILVAINLWCLYVLENIAAFSNTPDRIKDLGTICSIVIQFIALGLGAIYFFNNISYDKEKVICSRRNELLLALVKDYKEIRQYLNIFFYQEFKTDDEFKKFKDSAVDFFSTISAFIENSENIFIFSDSEFAKLIVPSSVIQTNEVFSLQSIDELKKHDLTTLRVQFSMALNGAMSTCWSGIK